MNFEIIASPRFRKDLKKLVKKYPSLKREYLNLVTLLSEKPKSGIPLGNDCFKIKISIESKGRGKSGGARVITWVQIIETKVYLLTIYDKSDRGTVSDKEILELVKFLE